MGRRRKHAPKRGSLAYLPRGRAKRHFGRIRYWPKIEADSPTLLGFAGYKVGMMYTYLVSDHRGSPTYGQEVFTPVSIIEAPPMLVCGFRAYTQSVNGSKPITEVLMKKPRKDLKRILALPEKFDAETRLKKIGESLDKISEFRAILLTQPRLAGVKQKKGVIMEVKVDGGKIDDQFKYLKESLGKRVRVSKVFSEGQFVDVVAVTKGKGIQGPVKRWGVRTLQKKSRKTVRGVACIGPWSPSYVMYTVPRAGQMGFHQRTEKNKRVLKTGSKGEEVTPKGGFPHYGVIRSDYIILSGSVPGPAKRLIKIRYPARPLPHVSEKPPQLTYLSSAPTG
jgi:large subunit ribosomal protein L3